MALKRYGIQIGIAIAVLLMVFWIFRSPTSRADDPVSGEPKGPQGMRERSSMHIRASSSPSSDVASVGQDNEGREIWSRVIRPLKVSESNVALESPADTAAAYSEKSAKAHRKDGTAALEIYQLAKYCHFSGRGTSRIKPTECDALEADNVRNPDYWLDLAINAGDARAAIIRFGNVRDAALLERAIKVTPEERAHAVAVLQEATRTGKAEVFAMLGSAYLDGQMVQQDFPKAYAYLDIYYKATGDSTGSLNLLNIAKNLKTSDYLEIEEIQQKVLSDLK